MNIEEISYMDAALALLAVILLIVFLGWILHRIADGGASTSKLSRRKKRLSIIETINVGPKSRVLLLRRDHKEYVILLGENKSLLIDGDIDVYENIQNMQKIEPRLTSQNSYGKQKTDNIEQKKQQLKTSKQKSPSIFSSFFNKTKPQPEKPEKKEPEFSTRNPEYVEQTNANEYQNEHHQQQMFDRINKHNIAQKSYEEEEYIEDEVYEDNEQYVVEERVEDISQVRRFRSEALSNPGSNILKKDLEIRSTREYGDEEEDLERKV